MSRRKKAMLALLSALGLIAGLFGAARVLLPRVIALAPVHQRIVTELSQRLGAAVEIRRIRLSAFPLPHVVLDDVRASVPAIFDATVVSAAVYPDLWALIRGGLQPGRIQLFEPDLHVQLQAAAQRADVSADELRSSLTSAVAAVSGVAAAQAAALTVVMKNGSLSLRVGEQHALRFTKIDAWGYLAPSHLDVDLLCASDLWKQLSLRGRLDTTPLKSSGRFEVEGLRPQLLSAYLPVEGAWRLGDSEVNFGVSFVADGVDTLQADVHASIPALAIQRGGEHLVLKVGALAAALRADAKSTTVTVSEIHSDYPRVRLKGQLSLDETATLGIEATDVDVASVREVATFLAGDLSVTRAVFGILRGGHVPRLVLHAHGRSLAGLGRLDAVTVQGQVTAGRVHVPRLDIDLEDVAGDVSVAKGVLAGDRLAARWGNTSARAGSLQVGLGGEEPELALQVLADADAAQVFALLKRVVRHGNVAAVLDRLAAVEGALSGRLILEGSIGAVSVTADVAAFKGAARVEGLSDRVQIDGEHLLYDAAGVRAANVNVKVGASALSRVSARVDWIGATSIEASCGPSRIALEEVYPWLLSSGGVRTDAWLPTALKGMLAVDALRLSGPVNEPRAWRVELAGALEHLEVALPALQRRLAIRYPLSVSGFRVHRDAKETALTGRIVATGNSTANLSLGWSDGALNIKELHVRDEKSDASLTGMLGQQRLDLSFAGQLDGATLDRLVEDPLLRGSARGDFRVHILLDEPLQSTAQGRLEVSDVTLALARDPPLRLERATIDANGERAVVDSIVHAAADTLHVQGHVERSAAGFVIDGDVGVDHLEWKNLEPFLRPSGEASDRQDVNPWSQQLRGILRVTTGSFTYGEFTWRPVRAEVALGKGAPTVRITEANLCGIATPAMISAAADGLALTVTPMAKNQPLDPALTCLLNQPGRVTGRCSLLGRLTAHGALAEFRESLRGQLELKATDGRIYRARWLAKVLSLLNVVTGWVGSLSDVEQSGLAYDTLRIKGDLRGGTLTLKETALNGPSIKMVCEGSIDVERRTVDLTLLVAPLKSVDTVVSHIPLVNKVLGGSLVTVPVKVTGPLDDPAVIPLDPSAVGSELLGFMKRTLHLPLQLIRPLLPGSERK